MSKSSESKKPVVLRKSDSTREIILDVAERLFAENAYEGTTMREIANGVGIREPSLYAHYANKEAIYGAVIDRALLPLSNEILLWSDSGLTLKALYDIPRKLMNLHAQHPNSAKILHQEFNSPEHRISPQVLQWQQRFVQQSQVFMDSLSEEGVDINKTKVVANMITLTNVILGYFSSQGMQQRLLGDEYNSDKAFEEQVRLVTRIFKSLLI